MAIPRSFVGRVVAALWLAACIAVLVFGLTARAIHDMPVAVTWFLIFLSFPLGAGAVAVLGVALGSSGVPYVPFWSELPVWAAAIIVGYLQWFVLVPAIARKVWNWRSHAA